jgi:hypothetical protein
MSDITAILTVYRRPHTLLEQLEALQNQSQPPTRIIIWKNHYDGIVLPEIPEHLMKNIDIINSNQTIASTYSTPISFNGEFNLFNLSSASINAFAGSTIITENTYGYDVYLSLGVANTRKIQLRQKCYPKFRQYNLHFLNRLGGWDTMKFALVNRRSTDFQRSSYRRNDWQLVGNQMQNVDSYNRYNETTLNYAIQHKDKYHLISDWVSEQDYDWLQQLVSSSIVYMEVLGAFFPVTVLSNTYNYKLTAADKLFNFEIDIEVGKYINSQFR